MTQYTTRFDKPVNPVKGTNTKTAAETLSQKYDSPDGGLREIRRRNGVDVDGPLDVRPEFARMVERRRPSAA